MKWGGGVAVYLSIKSSGAEFISKNENVYFYFEKHLNTEMVQEHYSDVIMSGIASQITSLTIVYSTAYSDADQRKLQSSASLAFVRGINRGPVNSPHKWPVTRKTFPFDDVIMRLKSYRVKLQDSLIMYTVFPYKKLPS